MTTNYNLILDVGCGFRPRGNVNIDISKAWNPRMYESDKNRERKIHEIPNFLLASACNLPFRNHVFDRVVSYSVLEHIQKPFQALKEIVRVCKGEGDIYVPHRFGCSAKKTPEHVSFFNLTWFNEAFKKLKVHDYDFKSTYKDLPHPFMPLFRLPLGIRVRFWVCP